jgi:hypothetical protein
MMRRILGFAVLAVLVWIVAQVALGLLGTLVGLAVTVLVFAAFGYLFYLVLRVVSPGTAARVRDVIRGHPANAP